ncbi:MAG: hypothetical protein ACO1OB_09910 [Archangium sp.]
MSVKGLGSPSQPQLKPVTSSEVKRPTQELERPVPRRTDDFEPSQPRGVALGHGVAPNDSGRGLNGSSGTLRSSSGRIGADAWSRPEQIVGHLTQNPARGDIGNSAWRCGPSSLLGSAIMQGPTAAANFLERVATGAASSRLPEAQKRELQTIAAAVRNGTATFEQLSRAQDLLYRAGNARGDVEALMTRTIASLPAGERKTELQSLLTQLQSPQGWLPNHATRAQELLTAATGQTVNIGLVDDPQHPGDASRQYYSLDVGGRQSGVDRSGFDDAEINGLANLGGATTRQVQLDPAARVQDLFAQLQPGETMTIRVGGSEDSDVSDHFVSIGRRADGTGFIYNTDPSNGDYTLFTGSQRDPQPANFQAQLERYNQRLLFDTDNDMPNATISRFPN